jgi:predicted glycoside hydrolase/deacetylase ChbG (UPF0249 family)
LVSGERTIGAQTSTGPVPQRRIWLCADDYGIAPGVNAAICDLIVRGRLNATSVMVGAPSFHHSDAASLKTLNAGKPKAALGLHVTLTAPFGPVSQHYAPLDDGQFLPLATTLRSATLRMLKPALLAAEVERQLEIFVDAFGRPPDFIDGHQHVHLFPQIRSAVLAVAKELAPNAWLRQCGRARPFHDFRDKKAVLLDLLSQSFRRRARRLGLRTNPAFAGTYDFNVAPDFAALFPTFLDRMPDGGVIMCHPGRVDAELRELDTLTDLREAEYAFLGGDDFPRLLAAQGVTLA